VATVTDPVVAGSGGAGPSSAIVLTPAAAVTIGPAPASAPRLGSTPGVVTGVGTVPRPPAAGNPFTGPTDGSGLAVVLAEPAPPTHLRSAPPARPVPGREVTVWEVHPRPHARLMAASLRPTCLSDDGPGARTSRGPSGRVTGRPRGASTP
jgi:hypothetical protein